MYYHYATRVLQRAGSTWESSIPTSVVQCQALAASSTHASKEATRAIVQPLQYLANTPNLSLFFPYQQKPTRLRGYADACHANSDNSYAISSWVFITTISRYHGHPTARNSLHHHQQKQDTSCWRCPARGTVSVEHHQQNHMHDNAVIDDRDGHTAWNRNRQRQRLFSAKQKA